MLAIAIEVLASQFLAPLHNKYRFAKVCFFMFIDSSRSVNFTGFGI